MLATPIVSVLFSLSTQAQNFDGPQMVFKKDTVNYSIYAMLNRGYTDFRSSISISDEYMNLFRLGVRYKDYNFQIGIAACVFDYQPTGYVAMNATLGYAINIYDIVELNPKIGYSYYDLSYITEELELGEFFNVRNLHRR